MGGLCAHVGRPKGSGACVVDGNGGFVRLVVWKGSMRCGVIRPAEDRCGAHGGSVGDRDFSFFMCWFRALFWRRLSRWRFRRRGSRCDVRGW
jgi:hypothetical protein